MSVESTTNSILSVIPVAITAGVAYKMADTMFQRSQAQPVTKKKKKKKDVYNRGYSGNFANVGF